MQPFLHFSDPVQTLRAFTPAAAWAALARSDEALDAGFYVAGYLSYEFGSACVGLPLREAEHPLLTLGVFKPPSRVPCEPEQSRRFRAGPLRPRMTFDQYSQRIAAIRCAIREGAVYQVNYTVPFDFAFEGDPSDAFAFLSRRTRAEYAAYVEDGDFALLSLSPELFLQFEGNRLRTKPMKGTAEIERLAELSNEKNRAEHVMIVDLLRNDLHRLCSHVDVERLYEIERYPTFATMTSTIAGTLVGRTPLAEIFRAMFPCGSVTGAPKRAAMMHIAQLEPQPREIYTGSIGYLTPQRTGWWNVAIRTAAIDLATGRGRLDLGGGIVADSQARSEWDEMLLKGRFFRDAIEPFAFWESFRVGPQPSDVDAHVDRLGRTARAFCVPLDTVRARTAIVEASGSAEAFCRLRLHVDGTIECATTPLEPLPGPLRVCLAAARVRSDDFMLAHKSAWRPAHEAAWREAQAAGCFDAILRNERGELTEGSRTNVFLQLGSVLYTPPLRCGVLPGILRSRIVSNGQAVERILHERDFMEASAIFVGNSARGLLPVQRFPDA